MTDKYPLSICMAGAVSAGAYSAGVMSVLLDALRLWDDASEDLPHRHQHRVEIKGMSGASAGSIQAVLSSLDLFAQDSSQNLGKSAWLNVSIAKLLELSDLEREGAEAQSVLNSEKLRVVAADAISMHTWGDWSNSEWPAFVANDYEVRLSVTNLRGIPYGLKLPQENRMEFGMSMHNEYLRYRFDTESEPAEEYFVIDITDQTKGGLDNLAKGALASSAFPMAFSSVVLDRPTASQGDYHDVSKWLALSSAEKDSGGLVSASYQLKPAPPSWNENFGKTETIFAVDGGATNNEPLVEAFKILFGETIDEWNNMPNESGTEKLGRVLMIDPFPNEVDREITDESLRVDKSLGSLISALVGHARFSAPIMLSQNLQDRVGLVYPSNPLRDQKPKTYSTKKKQLAIKSGALGGFSGFLKREFLEHDFELGRLNMQRFLRYHFTLSQDHPFFQNESAEWRAFWSQNGKIPIVPIYMKKNDAWVAFEGGESGHDSKMAYYQETLGKFSAKFERADKEALKKALKKRFKEVGRSLMDNHKPKAKKRYGPDGASFMERWFFRSRVSKWFTGGAVKVGWKTFGTGFLANTVVETIENSLADEDLLGYELNRTPRE